MRAIPSALSESLTSGLTTLCHLWRVERKDGQVFGFTDHDRDLTVDGLVFQAESGLAAGAMEKTRDLEIDTAEIEGALRSDRIAPADIAQGAWDGARVDVWRADWRAPERRVRLFAGRLGEIKRAEFGFSAELRGLQAPLDATSGRVFSRFCDAELGDGRCGADLTQPARRGSGRVARLTGAAAFEAEGLEGFAAGAFARGVLTWGDGQTSIVARHRVSGAVVTIEIEAARAVIAGDTFTLTVGCDKRFDTCRVKFDNVQNFRGFPHMVGNDAVQAGPSEDDMDGGSRWKD